MVTALACWQRRNGEDWVIHPDQAMLEEFVEQYLDQLAPFQSPARPHILLVERDPIRFLAGFLAACIADCPLFLGNPDWGDREWQQVRAIVQPNLVWGKEFRGQPDSQPSLHTHARIMIPTGGSSGQIRFAMHTWETLLASVQGFQTSFQLPCIHSCCTLPLYHVSGLMQFLRSFTSGGRLVLTPFKAIEMGQLLPIDPEGFCLSLVPTQLQRLLQQSHLAEWLARFQVVLLGGGPSWPALLDQARDRRIRLAPTYGMTETASQVATLNPDGFLQGQFSSGQPLAHAEILIRDAAGQVVPAQQVGTVVIRARSLALGYYPDRWFGDELVTDDLGYWDEHQCLHLVGRSSHKIITGGENVFPIEVESVILATGLVADVKVIGLPDQEWGQVVTAVWVPRNPEVTLEAIREAIAGQLSRFKQPKYWVPVPALPRNAQGKVPVDQVMELVMQQLHHPRST